MIRYSRQREGILHDLQSRRDHPTTEMIYDSVRRTQPNISLGTVYRNLSLLADQGQILRISTGLGPDRFDGFTEPHNHFICRCCGGVFDMEYVSSEEIREKVSESYSGKIEECVIQFLGTCEECLLSK